MADDPVTRGKFLRSLGSSMTGMALGTVGAAAHALATRFAATVPQGATAHSPSGGAGAQAKNLAPDPFVNCGPAEGNRIALTFDDGPTPGVTDRILDELRRRNIHATFFMIGERVAAAPDLARRVVAEGHEVGNHSFTHPKLNALPDIQVDLEIQKTQDIIHEILDYRPICFRPPYLAFRKDQAPISHGKGLKIICGDVNSKDWAQPGEEAIVTNIRSATKAGSIIICHDMHAQTANCVGQILDELRHRDFIFVTCSELVGYVT